MVISGGVAWASEGVEPMSSAAAPADGSVVRKRPFSFDASVLARARRLGSHWPLCDDAQKCQRTEKGPVRHAPSRLRIKAARPAALMPRESSVSR